MNLNILVRFSMWITGAFFFLPFIPDGHSYLAVSYEL